MSKMSGHGQVTQEQELDKAGSEREDDNELRLDDASSDDNSSSSINF